MDDDVFGGKKAKVDPEKAIRSKLSKAALDLARRFL
jgi:hypothetical protein